MPGVQATTKYIHSTALISAWSQSSGAVRKSRWTSWAPNPNKPTVSVHVKQCFNSTQCMGSASLVGSAGYLRQLRLGWLFASNVVCLSVLHSAVCLSVLHSAVCLSVLHSAVCLSVLHSAVCLSTRHKCSNFLLVC